LVDESIGAWLEALASPQPTPGGGSAAALMIAAGAALVEMVCGLTVGREKFRNVEEQMRSAARRASQLRTDAAGLREADEQAYGVVALAYALPKGTAEEKAGRSARIQEALHGATVVPLRAVATAVEVLELAAQAAGAGNPNVVSDAGSAALAARAGAESAALNVRINLRALKDVEFAARCRDELQALLDRGDLAARRTLDLVQQAIGG
jgi:formiminotetrahydrofolate cyclodeaminase